MDDKVLEPVKYYQNQGRQEHRANIEAHLKTLVDKSGVNIEENRATVAKLREKEKEIADLSKIIKKYKTFKTLLIIGIVTGAIFLFSGIGSISDSSVGTGIVMLLLGAASVAGFIFLLVKKVTPVIKNTDQIRQEKLAEAKELENQCWAQMQPLNALFTDEDAVRLIEKTLPEFAFEKNFSVEQEKLFVQEYDFRDLQDDESSMINTLSGKYAGNPFLFARRRVHNMGTHQYQGSLRITWVETYKDSDGNIRTREKSQTLYATVTKPKPYYTTNTFLVFGNQAAPNLSFSHATSHAENLSEKALEKKVKKGEKQIQKQAKKAVKNGGNFQEMANSEFEVLFGANDRDNEVEFRLMYTPLGQRSTVELLKDKNHYGDDFDFVKRGRCNLIVSDHAQNWKMNIFAGEYRHYDFEEIKSRFISYNELYFKSIFFDFAPFFCVPAYLEEPSVTLENNSGYRMNYTYYEHEVMSNALDYRSFVHEESCTEAILKTQVISAADGKDLIAVTAYSYMGIDRIDFVPVKGGDGEYHNVPVPWIEYIPISKTSQVLVSGDAIPEEYTSVYFHGMNAAIINN